MDLVSIFEVFVLFRYLLLFFLQLSQTRLADHAPQEGESHVSGTAISF